MAGEEEQKESGRGFKVADRRRFSPESGEPRGAAEESLGPSGEESEKRDSAPDAHAQPQSEALPEINFSTFVISLSTQALMNLGEISNPVTNKVEKDLPVAKQMIDIIGMLREKTRGNLSESEEQLMDDLLFDLRMKYVESVKNK